MAFEGFLKKTDEDDRYIEYHPAGPVTIFGCRVDGGECRINIAVNLKEEEAAPLLAGYLEWLAGCEGELKGYLSSKLGEELPEDWFWTIEVYDVSVTVAALDDFGAEVRLGESVFPDHGLMFYFEKYDIVDVGMEG